jgi:hypothetical protein
VTLSVTLLHCNVRGICETTDLLNIPRAIYLGDHKLWRYVSPEYKEV